MKLEKGEINVYTDYDEQFQAVGLIALLLLIIEIVLLERKNQRLSKLKLFKK